MDPTPKIVEQFPLTVEEVTRQFRKLPADASEVFYHYTPHEGMEGILRSGGLRATCRMRMNDAGEFDYARNVVYKALNEVCECQNLSPVAQSLTTYIRKNLVKFLDSAIERSSAYCACLSLSSDHPGQWEMYAENGKGFALGFNMLKFSQEQLSMVQRGEPYIYFSPVNYNENEQHDLVWRLVEAGIADLQTFSDTRSQGADDLTALRDRVTHEIVIHLFTLIDFIKAPIYNSEREMRLMLDSNDGTLNARNIQYYERGKESIPFIFMNLCSPTTKRLPLAEIKVGPNATFVEEKAFLENLLDELGYGNDYANGPRITQSLVALPSGL